MKKAHVTFFLSMLVFLAPVFPISSGPALAEGFIPAWEKGDTWQVAVTYKHAASRMHGKGEDTKPAAVFRYEIQDMTEDTFIVKVTPAGNKNEDGATLATLYIDIHSLALTSVKTTRTVKKRNVASKTRFSANRPVWSEKGIIPYDLPVFPLENGKKGTYTIYKKKFDDLKKRITLVQQVAEDEKGYHVKVSEGNGEVLFSQTWKKGVPWAVSGENRKMTYTLVEVHQN